MLASARSDPLQPQEITARRAEEARPLLSPVHAQSPAPASPTTAPESVAPTEPGAPLQAGAARNRATSIGAMSGVSSSWAGMHARARSDSKTLSELASGHVRALRRQGSSEGPPSQTALANRSPVVALEVPPARRPIISDPNSASTSPASARPGRAVTFSSSGGVGEEARINSSGDVNSSGDRAQSGTSSSERVLGHVTAVAGQGRDTRSL